MSTLTVHTDVVCPPDPSAICGRCGEELHDHMTADPDETPTLGDAMCVDDAYLAYMGQRPQHQFVLAEGDSLDCPGQMTDDVCGTVICVEHSTEFTSGAGACSGLHHQDCAHECSVCNGRWDR